MNILSLLLFATFVTVSHACFLLVAKRRQDISNDARMKLWKRHSCLNGTLWKVLLIWIISIQFYLPHSFSTLWMSILGTFLIGAGLFLVIKAHILLGRDCAMGIRFFFPQRAKRIKNSLYRFLNNPMYDGFILIFTGSGLVFSIAEDFYLAMGSFLLFNIFLASIENFEFKLNPF